MNMTQLLSVATMLASFGKKLLSSQNLTKSCMLALKSLNSREFPWEAIISVIPLKLGFGVSCPGHEISLYSFLCELVQPPWAQFLVCKMETVHNFWMDCEYKRGCFNLHLRIMVRIKLNNGYENTWFRARPIVVSKLEPGRHAFKSWQFCNIGCNFLICTHRNNKSLRGLSCGLGETHMKHLTLPKNLQDPG